VKVWVSYAKFEAAVPLEEEVVAEEEGREPDMAKATGQAEERARKTRGNAACGFSQLCVRFST
jgi:crooked neck